MRLRSCTTWTTSKGKIRRIRLYESWRNMIGRTRGGKSRAASRGQWSGVRIEWPDWGSFRAWALTHGYSRQRNSLDRIDSDGAYGPANCRWVTVSENTKWAEPWRYRQRAVPALPAETELEEMPTW